VYGGYQPLLVLCKFAKLLFKPREQIALYAKPIMGSLYPYFARGSIANINEVMVEFFRIKYSS